MNTQLFISPEPRRDVPGTAGCALRERPFPGKWICAIEAHARAVRRRQ